MSEATSAAAAAERVAGQEAGAGAAAEHVVDRTGHLVAHGVDGLGPEVGESGHERLAQRRVGLGQGQDGAGLAAVAVGEVGHGGIGVGRQGVVALGAAEPELLGARAAGDARDPMTEDARRSRRPCRRPSRGRS